MSYVASLLFLKHSPLISYVRNLLLEDLHLLDSRLPLCIIKEGIDAVDDARLGRESPVLR